MNTKSPKKPKIGIQEKFKQALVMQQRGAIAEAVVQYQAILKENPSHSGAIHCLGTIAAQHGQHQRAITLIRIAIKLDPDQYTYHHNQGLSHQALGELEEAIESYALALQLNPNSTVTLYNRGVAYLESGKATQAASDFNETVKLDPRHAQAYFNLGNCHRSLNEPAPALDAYAKAIHLAPDYLEARLNRAIVLKEVKAYEMAVAEYGDIAWLSPDQSKPLVERALLLMTMAQYEPALKDFDEALSRQPGDAEALCNRGVCLQKLGQPAAAIENFERAITVRPSMAEAFCNLGISLRAQGDLSEALSAYDMAISIDPTMVEAYCNKGVALKEAGLMDEAIATLNQAARIQPEHAETHGNLGVVLQKTRQFSAAIASYTRAIELKPDYLDARYNLALLHQELKQLRAALTGFESVLKLNPDYDYLAGTRLHTKMRLCEWDNHEADIADLDARVMGAAKASSGFPAVTLSNSPSVQRRAAETWVSDKQPYNPRLGPIAKRASSKKIRVGYYSADFYNHATSYLMAELFELHDRSEFEVIGFSFGLGGHDPMARRIAQSFTKFIDVRSESDIAIAKLSRELEIDIAVDLKGFTQGQRAGIFSYRAAPVQVNYLGYPGTMGANYIDYLIADEILIPERSQQYYSEKIVYLPDTYQVNDRNRSISDKQFTREEVGLPAEGFIYCCFNNNFKITPSMLDHWVRILTAVPASVLWLLQDNLEAEKNLRLEAARRGLDSQRLVFAPRMDLPYHLARHRLADLFLDTLPCNAHTTASDALWAGLPVVTCAGETFASRVASSLLSAVGLPELIATSLSDYESIAIHFGDNPSALSALKQQLIANRMTKPLFDTDRYTRNLESAFREMHHRRLANQAPANIHIR